MDTHTHTTPQRFDNPRFGGAAKHRLGAGYVDGWAGSPAEGTVVRIQMRRLGNTEQIDSMHFLAHACPWGVAMSDLACELATFWQGTDGGSAFWSLWRQGIEKEHLCPPIKESMRILVEQAIRAAGHACFQAKTS